MVAEKDAEPFYNMEIVQAKSDPGLATCKGVFLIIIRGIIGAFKF